MAIITMASSPDKEKDVTILVTCERCSSKLETALSKDSTRYDLCLRVTPCETCQRAAIEEADLSVQSIRLVLNDSERESVSIS